MVERVLENRRSLVRPRGRGPGVPCESDAGVGAMTRTVPMPVAEFSFCESSSAGPQSPWHLRELTSEGRKLGGGIDTRTLCGRVRAGWDLEVELTPFHLHTNTCKDCLERYQNLVAGSRKSGKGKR